MNDKISVDDVNLALYLILSKQVKQQELGFINNDCTASMLSIMTKCVEIYDLFDEEQTKNINYMINNLMYGRAGRRRK